MMPTQGRLLDEFSRFVCAANLSLNQAVQPQTVHFCNSLIEHGFRIGQSCPIGPIPGGELLPQVGISKLRSRIISLDAACIDARIREFQSGFVHLSLDAATIQGNSVLDFILRRTMAGSPTTDYVLFESVGVERSTQKFYMETTAVIIERLSASGIRIHSIVGDGFSSQLRGLSPESQSSIQNSAEYIGRCPSVAGIFYISAAATY
jgi:hypothetical protein